VSDYRLDDRGSIPERGKGFFLCPQWPDQLWGPPSLLSNGYRWSFPGGEMRPGRDADHSHHLVQRSRISRSYTFSPPWRLHGVAGQDLLSFTLLYLYYMGLFTLISGTCIILFIELYCHWCSELSSWMYCRVKRLSTDVSEVRTASITRDEFYTAVHPRRQFWTSYSPPWELEISQVLSLFFPDHNAVLFSLRS
jgi:hypothetical protein